MTWEQMTNEALELAVGRVEDGLGEADTCIDEAVREVVNRLDWRVLVQVAAAEVPFLMEMPVNLITDTIVPAAVIREALVQEMGATVNTVLFAELAG